MADTKIKVLRKGKVKEVSRIQVGDIRIGKCWICDQRCRLTRLANGRDRHEPVAEGQGSLFSE